MLALQQAAAAVVPVPDLRIFVYFSIAVFACRCRNLYLMTYNKGSIALREHQSHTGGAACCVHSRLDLRQAHYRAPCRVRDLRFAAAGAHPTCTN